MDTCVTKFFFPRNRFEEAKKYTNTFTWNGKYGIIGAESSENSIRQNEPTTIKVSKRIGKFNGFAILKFSYNCLHNQIFNDTLIAICCLIERIIKGVLWFTSDADQMQL